MIDAYLASPYSNPDPAVRIRRFELVSQAAAELMRRGHVIFVPISMTHPMAIYGNLNGDWEFWKRFDTVFLGACNELWVLMLNGWYQSVGVRAEINLALEMGKVVEYIHPGKLGVEDE